MVVVVIITGIGAVEGGRGSHGAVARIRLLHSSRRRGGAIFFNHCCINIVNEITQMVDDDHAAMVEGDLRVEFEIRTFRDWMTRLGGIQPRIRDKGEGLRSMDSNYKPCLESVSFEAIASIMRIPFGLRITYVADKCCSYKCCMCASPTIRLSSPSNPY